MEFLNLVSLKMRDSGRALVSSSHTSHAVLGDQTWTSASYYGEALDDAGFCLCTDRLVPRSASPSLLIWDKSGRTRVGESSQSTEADGRASEKLKSLKFSKAQHLCYQKCCVSLHHQGMN